MSTSTVSSARPGSRLWNRSLDHYPADRARFTSLGIVVLTTVILYYQLYLAGGVATNILRDLNMSFTYYVNISVVGYLLGASASVLAGLADRYGRANIVTVGLGITGILCLFVLPEMNSKIGFGIVFVAIGFVEGIVLVATPALVRDFSPQLGRASAMGFWTLGPVLGSLVVSGIVSSLASDTTWQHHYRICGVISLVVFAVALLGLRELSPKLRDQLMVSMKDRALIEARAKGLDVSESLKKPFRQMLHLDIIGSAFAISVFLTIYYLAVGFFPVFFETIHGYSQSKANALGNYFWTFDALGLLIIGYLSDRIGVRKPFMIVGAVLSIIFTTIFAIKSTDTGTSYTTFVVLLICIAISLGIAYAPWMASFTETVEKRNPALIATGLAVWGLIIRICVAVIVFFVPKVVTTATTLVEKGPEVQAVLADPTPVGQTTVGKVATAASENPAVVAQLQVIDKRSGALLGALQANPAVAKQLAAAQAAGTTPTPKQLAALKATLGNAAFAELIGPNASKDLAYVSTTAPKALGPANFAALSKPTPQLQKALGTLSTEGPGVAKAAKDSPDQWKTFFFIGVAGQVVFIPLVLLMAGFWDPKKAKAAEEEHERRVAEEMRQYEGSSA